MGSSSRVSIPKSARPTIQNIKEITGNHSDEEVYAMLRECSMDPNETTQKLLLQDTFHEVKRKRDKRKDNIKEPAETRWRPPSQGRGGRGGWGNYSSRYVSHDAAGGGRIVVKENGIPRGTDKRSTSSSTPSQETEVKSAIHTASSVVCLANGLTKFENPTAAQGSVSEGSGVSGKASVKEILATTISETGARPIGDVKSHASVSLLPSSDQFLSSTKPASVSRHCTSVSDPVLVPAVDAHNAGGVGTINREVGSQRSVAEATIKKVVSPDVPNSDLLSFTGIGSSEMNHAYVHGKGQGKSHGLDGNQPSDGPQAVSSLSRTSSAGSRPSSNYSNRSQQQSGPQRVGPVKEWKPKVMSVKPPQASEGLRTSDVELITGEPSTSSIPASTSLASEASVMKLQRKLEELQVLDTKHVIIPNHLQVPESERTGLSFGSFDANFGLSTSYVNDTESDKSSAQLSESSQEVEENTEDPVSSTQNTSTTTQEADYAEQPQQDYAEQPHQAPHMPEILPSKEPDISSSIPNAPEYDHLKPEVPIPQEGSQYSVVHSAPTYSNFGLVPQILGNQFATFEGAEPQARDATRIPSFVVQQPLDPSTSYYTSVYRPTGDGDGRFSPFFASGAANKYNGNIAVLPTQTGQSQQASTNSVLSSTVPASLLTQPAGVMHNSVAGSQQSVPVFRQPAGVHIPHFPANYLPYSQYFSPFYGPPPTIHPFLSNAAFPQQPPSGSIYAAPGSAAAAGPVKYAMSQYKPATNTGNPSHVGMPIGYGTYNPSALSTGNSSGTDDRALSQYKENNVYIAGPQSEGSAVWIPAPGREMSGLQPASFYNLQQGQHMAFPGIYHHPTQAVPAGTVHPMLQQSQTMAGAVEMVGPPAGVYQQPQRTWVNNY